MCTFTNETNKLNDMKNLTKGNGELTVNVLKGLEVITGTKIYTDTWVGSNRHKNLRSLHSNVVLILDELKLKYKTGNDAARGGAEGNYINISKRAFDKISKLKN